LFAEQKNGRSLNSQTIAKRYNFNGAKIKQNLLHGKTFFTQTIVSVFLFLNGTHRLQIGASGSSTMLTDRFRLLSLPKY